MVVLPGILLAVWALYGVMCGARSYWPLSLAVIYWAVAVGLVGWLFLGLAS